MNENHTTIKLTGTSAHEENWKKFLLKDSEELCKILNFIKFGLEEMLTDFADTGYQLTADFLKATDPLKFIKLKFVEAKKIHLPGLKETAFLEGDMLAIPEDILQAVLADRKKFDLLYENATKRFDINIKDFYIDEDGSGLFVVGEKFEQFINDLYSAETSNEFENEVIIALQNFVDSVNALIKLGIVHSDIRWTRDVAFDPKFIPINPNNQHPLSLSRHALSIAKTFAKNKIAKQNNSATEQAVQIEEK